MRQIFALLPLLWVLALPAAAQEQLDKIKFKPREIARLHMLPGRPPQGIWQFGDGQFLVTQDADGGKQHEWVRFTLFDKDGEPLRKWELEHGTHGQSLYVDKHKNGYTIYTEGRKERGVAIFELDAERTGLKFVRRVVPRDESGHTLELDAFGVDDAADRVIVANGGARKWIRYYKFSDFIAGRLTPLGSRVHVRKPAKGQPLGSLQGVGTFNSVGYVLTGDGEVDSKKYIARVDEYGNMIPVEINPDRDKAKYFYEPEGLYVRNGRILFTMYDRFWTRVYEVRAK